MGNSAIYPTSPTFLNHVFFNRKMIFEMRLTRFQAYRTGINELIFTDLSLSHGKKNKSAVSIYKSFIPEECHISSQSI